MIEELAQWKKMPDYLAKEDIRMEESIERESDLLCNRKKTWEMRKLTCFA